MLHAWLEFIDTQTGGPRRVDLEHNTLSIGRTGGDLRVIDAKLADVHAIVTRERESFVIRDLGSGNGTFVNERAVLEAQLTNLDQIRIGETVLTFHAAYLTPEAYAARFEKPSAQPETGPAPGHTTETARRNPLIPFSMIAHPLRFWPRALGTGVFQFHKTWATHVLVIGIILASALSAGDANPLPRLGFLVFAVATALALTAITCSVFFAFDTLTDAPHRLSQALRFTFHVAPFVLAAQAAFLTWAAKAHPRGDRYFLASAVPTLFYVFYFAIQSRHAFGASLIRGMAFALTSSVPWNLLMTGLMSFLV